MKLARSQTDRIIAGVCGGLAAYLGITPFLVRLGFVALVFASGIGILLYLILMFIMPRESGLGDPASKIAQDNLSEFSDTVTSSLKRAQKQSGPGILGWLLIAIGVYILLGNISLLFSSSFWVIVILVAIIWWWRQQ